MDNATAPALMRCTICAHEATDLASVIGHELNHHGGAQTMWPVERPTCPDEGTCHHRCVGGCFRVLACGPLSAHGDSWTEDEVAMHGAPVRHTA